MTSNIAKIAKGILRREFLDFRRFHVDVKNIKTLSNGGETRVQILYNWFLCKTKFRNYRFPD
jgi:hypothetical protein